MLEEVQLHEGLEEIGDRAFYYCVSLRLLDCPSTVVRIGRGAFFECKQLEEVQLHRGLEEIGDGAFFRCFSLRLLDCPSTVVRIGRWAFFGCKQLEEVQLHEGLEEIGDEAFCCCYALLRLDWPSTVVQIGRDVFRFCLKLEEVQLRKGLEEIGDGAFFGCASLRHLDCPSTVVRIGDNAFWGCRKLSVELAGIIDVETGPGSLAGWKSLEHIGIPSGAFVLKRGTNRNYTPCPVTDDRTTGASVLVAPGCLTALPESNLTKLGNSTCAIMNNDEGTEEDRLGQIRQEVRKEVRGEVAAVLGLAFWKANIDEVERTGIRAAKDRHKNKGLRKRAKVSVALTREARGGCRGAGKGKLIAENVLPFLDDLWGNKSQGGL